MPCTVRIVSAGLPRPAKLFALCCVIVVPARIPRRTAMPLVAPPNGKLHGLARKLTSASDAELADIAATRRGLILAPLLAAALPIALLADPAHAIDPTQTQIILPDQMLWKPWSAGGAVGAMESAAVLELTHKPGPYAILVRWHPGYMSAPHTYVTDRLCFVISGTWWMNSG